MDVMADEGVSLGPETEARSGAGRPLDQHSDTPGDRCVLCRLCRANPKPFSFRLARYTRLQNKMLKRSAFSKDSAGPQEPCVHRPCRRKGRGRAQTKQ